MHDNKYKFQIIELIRIGMMLHQIQMITFLFVKYYKIIQASREDVYFICRSVTDLDCCEALSAVFIGEWDGGGVESASL